MDVNAAKIACYRKMAALYCSEGELSKMNENGKCFYLLLLQEAIPLAQNLDTRLVTPPQIDIAQLTKAKYFADHCHAQQRGWGKHLDQRLGGGGHFKAAEAARGISSTQELTQANEWHNSKTFLLSMNIWHKQCRWSGIFDTYNVGEQETLLSPSRIWKYSLCVGTRLYRWTANSAAEF